MAEYRDRLLRLQGEMLAWKAHSLRLLTEAAQGVDSGVRRMIIKYGGTMLGFRLASLAVDALGAAGLPFESQGEDAEDDDATTWNIDYMYDVGLMIGGGSNNIQKNIISRTRSRSAARAEGREGLNDGIRAQRGAAPVRRIRCGTCWPTGCRSRRCAAMPKPAADSMPELWDSLVALGLPGLLVPERFGGAGLGVLDAVVAAEALGATAAPAPFAGSIVMATLAFVHGATEALQDEWLPRIAAGEVRFGVAFAGLAGQTGAAAASLRDGRLSGRITGAIDCGAPTHLLVYLADGHAAVVSADDPGVSQHMHRSVDRTRPVADVEFDNARAVVLDAANAPVGAAQRVLDAGRLVLAADTLGAAQHMFDHALDFVKQRVQFGRVIGSFQAVKHQFADMVTVLEPCRAMVWYAAYAQDALPDEARLTALQPRRISATSAATSRAWQPRRTAAWGSPTCSACTTGSSASASTARCWADPSVAAKKPRGCRAGSGDRLRHKALRQRRLDQRRGDAVGCGRCAAWYGRCMRMSRPWAAAVSRGDGSARPATCTSRSSCASTFPRRAASRSALSPHWRWPTRSMPCCLRRCARR